MKIFHRTKCPADRKFCRTKPIFDFFSRTNVPCPVSQEICPPPPKKFVPRAKFPGKFVSPGQISWEICPPPHLQKFVPLQTCNVRLFKSIFYESCDELNSTDLKLLNYTVSLLRFVDGGAQNSQSHFAVNFICNFVCAGSVLQCK